MQMQLRIKLGRLASAEFQRRYCVHGTTATYVLPSELLESAANGIEALLASPSLSEELSRVEITSLRELLEMIVVLGPRVPLDSDSISVEELVEKNPEWERIRAKATDCLSAFGLRVDFKELA
jgi:hypothetical protein